MHVLITVLTSLLILLFLAAGTAWGKEEKRGRPNIIFIIVDQLKATAIGSYGNAEVKTPNLDSLAGGGVRFEYAFVQSPLCIPSRACLLTGRYPQCLGLLNKDGSLTGDEIFIADVLREAGYWAGSLGKMHHIPPSDKRGFEDLYDIPEWEKGKAWMVREHVKNVARTPNAAIAGISGLATEDHPTSQLTNKALRVLRERAAETDRPFFLWVSYPQPHHPCLPSPEYAAMYDPKKITLPDNFGKPPYYGLWHMGMMQRYLNADFDADEDAIRTFIARYYGEISLIDYNIGRIMKELEHLRLLDNTLVVFTADHGDFAGEHGAIMKGDVYDALTRVPFIMRFPECERSGKSVPALVEQVDIMPTLLEFAGVAVPETVQGKTLLPLIDGKTNTHKRFVFSMIRTWPMRYGRYMVRSDEWLYIEDAELDREMLFNVKEDPGQTNNLILLPENRGILSTYRQRLRSFFEGEYTPVSPGYLPRQMQSSASDTNPPEGTERLRDVQHGEGAPEDQVLDLAPSG